MTSTTLLRPSDAMQAAQAAIDEFIISDEKLAEFGVVTLVDSEWATVEVAARDSTAMWAPSSEWDALTATRRLHGNAKWCLSPLGMSLRAAVPLENSSPEWVDRAVRDAADGVIEALHGPDRSRDVSQVSASGCLHGNDLDVVLEAVQSEYGWITRKRNDGGVVIELSSMGRGGHVELARADTGWLLSTSLSRDSMERATPELLAVAAFLLRCSASVHGCRAAADEHGFFGFEAQLTRDITELAIHHAMAAISAAVARSRAEVRALVSNPRLARVYLASGYGLNSTPSTGRRSARGAQPATVRR